MAHRDLKPENFLVKLRPFQVVIADFGLSKGGTLKYTAPEVFPGLSDSHGPKVDVWSLGITIFECIYGLPTLSVVPKPRRKYETIKASQWSEWVVDWITLLLNRLEDEGESQLIEMLFHMIEVNERTRWPTNKCLALGFESGLF